MPTSNNTNKSTKVSTELQADLAQYGLVRAEAIKNAPVKRTGTPNFFGIKNEGSETVLKFNTSIETIQDNGMTVALVAPENESFNMLVTKDFKKAVEGSTIDNLRSFVRRIFDRA